MNLLSHGRHLSPMSLPSNHQYAIVSGLSMPQPPSPTLPPFQDNPFMNDDNEWVMNP